MNQGIKTIIYAVRDRTRATYLYGTLLGVEPYVDEAYYRLSTLGNDGDQEAA